MILHRKKNKKERNDDIPRIPWGGPVFTPNHALSNAHRQWKTKPPYDYPEIRINKQIQKVVAAVWNCDNLGNLYNKQNSGVSSGLILMGEPSAEHGGSSQIFYSSSVLFYFIYFFGSTFSPFR